MTYSQNDLAIIKGVCPNCGQSLDYLKGAKDSNGKFMPDFLCCPNRKCHFTYPAPNAIVIMRRYISDLKKQISPSTTTSDPGTH